MEVVRLRARTAVKAALKSGALEQPSKCERCGAAAALESHHPDYAKPLAVEWVCDPCHTKISKQLADMARVDLPNRAHAPGFKGTPSWAMRERKRTA